MTTAFANMNDLNGFEEEEEENNECPLCMEEFDVTDKSFKPCKCGYQICVWCWHKIMEDSKRCPNCRRNYEHDTLNFTPPDPAIIQTEKKNKQKKRKVFSRKQLANVRVIQRNLVYVVGLSLDITPDDNSLVQWLKRHENFGQYGKIMKIVINKNNLQHAAQLELNGPPTVSAYITYSKREEAFRAIQAVDETWLDGKQLRASFGTTKYCAYFLRGIPCTNPECMYLHDYGNEEDTFNKEDIVLRNGLPVPHSSAKRVNLGFSTITGESAKPTQFFPDDKPVKKHHWNFRNSNVAQAITFEPHYVEEDEEQEIELEGEDYEDDFPVTPVTTVNVLPNFNAPQKSGSILPPTAQWAKQSDPVPQPQPVQTSQSTSSSKKKKKQQKKQQKKASTSTTTKQPQIVIDTEINSVWSQAPQEVKQQQPTSTSKQQPITITEPVNTEPKKEQQEQKVTKPKQASASDLTVDVSAVDFSNTLLSSLEEEIEKEVFEPEDIANEIIDDSASEPIVSTTPLITNVSWPTEPEALDLGNLTISKEPEAVVPTQKPLQNLFQQGLGAQSTSSPFPQYHQQSSFVQQQTGPSQQTFQPNLFFQSVQNYEYAQQQQQQHQQQDPWAQAHANAARSRNTSRFQFANQYGEEGFHNNWFESTTTSTNTTTGFGHPFGHPQPQTHNPYGVGPYSNGMNPYAGMDLQQTFRALLPNVNINFSYAQQNEQANNGGHSMLFSQQPQQSLSPPATSQQSEEGYTSSDSRSPAWGNPSSATNGSQQQNGVNINSNININFFHFNQQRLQQQQQEKVQSKW